MTKAIYLFLIKSLNLLSNIDEADIVEVLEERLEQLTLTIDEFKTSIEKE